MPIKAKGFHENQEEQTSDLLFLKTGVTHLRVLPAYNAKGNWFRTIREIPRFVDGKYSPLISPATLGEHCPFVEKGSDLYKKGGEVNIELARKYRPRNSFLFNVIVKSTPEGDVDIEQCVKVLKCGVLVKRQILEIDQDHAGGYGDITNLEEGFDIRITRTGSGPKDTTYSVMPVPNKDSILEWLENKKFTQELTPHDLDVYFTPGSDEEVQSAFDLFEKELKTENAPPEKPKDEDNLKPPVAPVVSETPEPVEPLQREA